MYLISALFYGKPKECVLLLLCILFTINFVIFFLRKEYDAVSCILIYSTLIFAIKEFQQHKNSNLYSNKISLLKLDDLISDFL